MIENTSMRLFGYGVLTGAALVFLFAPTRGRDVRGWFGFVARRGRDHASWAVSRTRRTVNLPSNFVETVRRHGVMAVTG